tara:strand:+ start:423 stop:10784 length:10362 start_codon:yes stop_codon:yes gene_type:complete
MPKEVQEIQDFNQGTVTTHSERDITPETAAYSLNVDPLSEDGKLVGVPEDRIVASLSENVPFEPLNYGLQWGAAAIRIADLSKIPEASTDGEGSRVIFQGTRGVFEILKYTSSYFDTSQIKDSLLNIEGGLGDSTGELSKDSTEIHIIDWPYKKSGLINVGDVIALSSETDVANIPKSIEWMLVTGTTQTLNILEVQRGYYNTEPVEYTSLGSNTNIYKLTGLSGWLNVSGWQTNYKNNHIGQNPCIIYVANAGASSADNLTHDATNKTITITQNSLVNNLGANDAIEDLVKNNDVIKIINASGGVATVKVDYVTDGVINYSSISGSLSTQTSGKYWIDCNKIANGNFRAYDTSADGKAPYGWTTSINPSGTATYDDVYADDTKSIGSPQLATTGGITGLKGNERDTSNSNYDSTESPFLILSNARDVASAVNSITLTDALDKDGANTRFRVSNPSLLTEGDTLVLSHGVGITLVNTSGNAYTGTDNNPYLQNHYNPGYAYESINVASFTDNDAITVTVPTSIGGTGVGHILRLEDTSSASLTSTAANAYVNISNEDAAGANASDAQLALNIVAAITGCSDTERVIYGTAAGIGDAENGIAGISASVNTETNTKVDIWPTNGLAEEYVKVTSIEVSQDAGGDAQPGFITVQRAYHGNLQAHAAGASIKRILRTQIKQTVGASNFDAVQEGKRYKLTWWVADITKAWLGNNDYHLKPRLNFKIGCAGGYLLGEGDWSSDKGIVGANGEKAWLNSTNYSTALDSNKKTLKGDFGGSIYHTFAGNKDIYNNTATGWVRGSISDTYQVGTDNFPRVGNTMSFVQDSGTTQNGNWTLGDTTDDSFVNSDNFDFSNGVASTSLIHLSGALHPKSIFGIPNMLGEKTYFAGVSAGLAGETVPASDGSAPKRRAYIEFEDFVGWNLYDRDTIYAVDIFISSADGRFARFVIPTQKNPTTNFADGRYVGTPYYTTVSNASEGWLNSTQAKGRMFYLVPTDGGDIGYYQDLPTQIASGGTWVGDGSDSKAGSVLNDGTAWANSLKECIETAFNNYQGDGVTRFTVTQNGAALCIEDAIGGDIADNWTGEYTDAAGTSYVRNEFMHYSYYNVDQFSTGGKMHFTIRVNTRMINSTGFMNSFKWVDSDSSKNGQSRTDNGTTGDHKGYLKGDGLGFNLGSITSGGGYAISSDRDVVTGFLTCFHIGADPTAAQGVTNLDLAIEHANGMNGRVTGAVANTDELTLTLVDAETGGQSLDLTRVPDRLETNTSESFSTPSLVSHLFEFYTGVNNSGTGSGKTLIWHKCEFDFTLPKDKDISELDVYFESDGEVWGTRDGSTINSGVVDKYSSLIGIDSISLVENVEILPSIETGTNITSSASIKDSNNKELLLYHDKNTSSLNVLEDFGDPLDGHTNTFMSANNIPYEDVTLNKAPTFTKNNREFHIGMGPDNPAIWAGFLNHKQFGTDFSNQFIIDKSEVESFDAEGAYSIDKLCRAGFWLCELNNGASFSSDSTKLNLNIPTSEFTGSATNTQVNIELVGFDKQHVKSGTQATLDTNTYEATCMYMHPWHYTYSNSSGGTAHKNIKLSGSQIYVDSISNDITTVTGKFAFKVSLNYSYGIARGTNSIFRINDVTGAVEKGTLPFKAHSICPAYSQSENEVGTTGSRFSGGRVWILDKDGGQIHKVNVANAAWENFTVDVSITPRWCTWWSSTDADAASNEIITKDRPPTDVGYMSDIVETWGLKGDTGSISNDSDTRLWIQFYPKTGDSFGPLDNFIYCGNTDSISGPIANVNFCNRTIPLNHTGGATQDEFDPNARYGKTLSQLKAENVSSVGNANENISQRGRLISKVKLKPIEGEYTRWAWFNPQYINHKWVANSSAQYPTEIHYKRANGNWDYDDVTQPNTSIGLRNYAENIGWDSDAPSFKMIKFGLIGLGDNDFDGVIDGTGLPVSSAANVNIGFENGKDCSSHAAAVLMQTDAKWILNGQVAFGQGQSGFYEGQGDGYSVMGLQHSGEGFTDNHFGRTAELYKPDAFFMVTSDIWKMEKADSSSSYNDNANANSKGAHLIPTENNNPKFSHASKDTDSTHDGSGASGQLEHWSSSDWTDSDRNQFKDRVHVFRTADKHHLSIGNNLLFASPNEATGRGSFIFGQENFHNATEYGHLCPVVGIIDDYHFLMQVTHGGNGRQGPYTTVGLAGASDFLAAGTFVDNLTDALSGGTVTHKGTEVDYLNWKVGGSNFDAANYINPDGELSRKDGGRYTLDDTYIEGSGVKFFSDGNMIGTYLYDGTNNDASYGKPQGVSVFPTSLLSFCHGRMIRPLGDTDVSGVSNFNIDNSISLYMASSPDRPVGLHDYNEGATCNAEPSSHLCHTKLYMTQISGTGTLMYSFDWDNIMPDTNRATYEGVDYSNEVSSKLRSTHRPFGTYELGDRTSRYRRDTTLMRFYNMHANDDTHLSAKGRFILNGSRNAQSDNAGNDGDQVGSGGTLAQNFMIPGGFMIKTGASHWDDTQFQAQTEDYEWFAAGHAGIILGGDRHSLIWNANNGKLHEDGSLFSPYGEYHSPFLRKGGLNDFIAIWSHNSPIREIGNSNNSYLNFDEVGYNTTIPGFSTQWCRGIGRSVARKIISSYATCGGYDDQASITDDSGTLVSKGGWQTQTILPSGSSTVRSDFTDYGFDGNNMLLCNDSIENKMTFDVVRGEIFLRTHYPLPGTPGAVAGDSVTFIQSRDAALAPVRLDLELLPAYTGYYGPGTKAPVKVTGVGNQIKIVLGKPCRGDDEGDWQPYGQNPGLRGENETDNEHNLKYIYDPFDNNNKVRISGTASYNGDYICGDDASYGRFAGVYEGNSSGQEMGFIEPLGGSEMSNPAFIEGSQGLSISGRNYATHNINGISGRINLSRHASNFYTLFMGASKAGKFKTGRIQRSLSVSSGNKYKYNQYNGSFPDGDVDKSHSFLPHSSENHWNFTNNPNYLMQNEDAHLWEADVTFLIEPASAANAGDAHFVSTIDYFYKVSLVYDGYQEGPLSETSWGITNINGTNTYEKFNVTLSVNNPNKRLTSICLYRKNGTNNLYRLVSEVSTNNALWEVSGNEYKITILDDGGLGATFESRAGFSEVLTNPFVKYGIGTSIAGYHFVTDCSHPQIEDASHMIFRSLPGQFDLFNWANDFMALPTKATALANFAGRLYAFDEINTYRINPETLVIEDTFHGSGCLNERSLIVTDFGMFYCDRNNAYMHDGQSPRIISQSIKKGGGSDISNFNISDFSWEKTVGAKDSMKPFISFDNKRNAVLFFVEKPGDELVNHSRYYCWAYSILLSRWDLWEVSTGDNGSGVFDSSKVVAPSSIISTLDGKSFMTMGDYLINFLGGTNKKPWQFLSKKLTVGTHSQKKVWKNIQLIGNDDDVTTSVGDPKGSISIAIDDTVIGSSDRTFTKDTPDGKVTIKGTSKTGRYLQFLLTEMTESVDAIGIVFRRKGIK